MRSKNQPLESTDLDSLPALLNTMQLAQLVGLTDRAIQYQCRKGTLPNKKVGGRYFINTKEALKAFGLED